ncbi:MAG TPA: helix-turn-helix transcriptional regulator [Prolixibacteraceae bacterium]|nr:helix-turn-helix transcriptional regulator [Prolixibacteraceae bacterium]
MRERILKIIESEGITAAEFADSIGVQRSNVSHVLNGRSNPGFLFIQKILETYTRVNSRWLITGSGSIYEDSANTSTANVVSKPVTPNLFSTSEQPNNEPKKTVTPPIRPLEFPNTAENNEVTNVKKVEISKQKTISKVLIFYSDHTFEDYRPAE